MSDGGNRSEGERTGRAEGPAGRPDVPELGPADLHARMERGEEVRLLDVREPFEREIADLPERGQLRIPVGELVSRMDELDRSEEIVVYCRSGSRSEWAVGELRRQGFPKVWNLRGGLLRWREEVDPDMTAY